MRQKTKRDSRQLHGLRQTQTSRSKTNKVNDCRTQAGLGTLLPAWGPVHLFYCHSLNASSQIVMLNLFYKNKEMSQPTPVPVCQNEWQILSLTQLAGLNQDRQAEQGSVSLVSQTSHSHHCFLILPFTDTSYRRWVVHYRFWTTFWLMVWLISASWRPGGALQPVGD